MIILRASALTGRWEEQQDEVTRRLGENRQLQLKPAEFAKNETSQLEVTHRSNDAAA